MNEQTIKFSSNLEGLLGNEPPKVRMTDGDNANIWVIILYAGSAITFWIMSGFLSLQLYKDYKIQQNPIDIEAAIETSCSTRSFVIQDCNVEITWKNQQYEMNYAYFGLTSVQDTQAVQHAENSKWVSTNIALEKWFSRLYVLVFIWIMAICLSVLSYVSGSRRLPRIRFVMNDLNNGIRELALCPINISMWMIQHKVNYQAIILGQTKLMVYELDKKSDYDDLFTTFDHQGHYAVVVIDRVSGNYLMLDRSLRRFKLSKQERSKLRTCIEDKLSKIHIE